MTTNSKIEFLESVDIREVWSKEDRNFTPWIADPEVTAKLLDQCGIDYDGELTIETEVTLSGYKRKLDVLVKSSSGDRIAIENQFNEADHDHMTRALAYAVGLDAKAVIIVAESHRPEFVAVANYLNAAALSHQDKGIPIFLVSIELFAAPSGGSYFPRFEIVARPDEWKAAVFQGTHSSGVETERKVGMFNFHDRILDDVRQVTGIFKNVNPSSNPWKAGSFGVSSVQIAYIVAKDATTASIWIHSRSVRANSAGLHLLKENEAEIQSLLKGHDLNWREQETSSLEISIAGIGWGVENAQKKKELLNVLGALTSIAKKYVSEFRSVMKATE